MKTIKAIIKSHPLLSFYTLAFAISWGGILIVVGGPGGFPATKEQAETLMPFVMLAWLAGPSVANILMTGLVYGREGLREFRSRLLKWRIGARWYAVSLVTAPLVFTAVVLGLSLRSPEFLPSILATNDKVALLLMGIAYALVGGFFEELGWTGFAIPRMRMGYGVLGTGLIVGVLWGAYHFSVVYWASSPSSAFPLAILLVSLFAWMPAYRVLMVWVYDHTNGSLFVVILMHVSLIASMFILQPLAISGVAQLAYLLVLAATMWVVVGVVAMANHRHLTPQLPPRRQAA